MKRTEIANQSSCKVGDPGKDLDLVELLKTCFVIEEPIIIKVSFLIDYVVLESPLIILDSSLL